MLNTLPLCFSIQVVLGGGRRYMFPNTTQDPEYPSHYGDRNDGENLVLKWLQTKKVSGRFYMVACQVWVWVQINPTFPLAGNIFTVCPSSSQKCEKFVFIHCLQNAKYVWKKDDFDAVNPKNTDFLIGKKNWSIQCAIRKTGPNMQDKSLNTLDKCNIFSQCMLCFSWDVKQIFFLY